MKPSQTMQEFLTILANATMDELKKYNIQDHTDVRMLKIVFNKINNKYLYHYITEVKQDLMLRAWTYIVLERGFKVLGEWDATKGYLGHYISHAMKNKVLNLINAMIKKNSHLYSSTSKENDDSHEDAYDIDYYGTTSHSIKRIDYDYVNQLKEDYLTLKSQQATFDNPNMIKAWQNKMDRLEATIKQELGEIQHHAIDDTFQLINLPLSIEEECENMDKNGLINHLMKSLSNEQQIVLACLLNQLSYSNVAPVLKIKNPKAFKKILINDIIDILETRQWQMDDDFITTFERQLNSTSRTMAHINQNKGEELENDIKDAIKEHFDTIKANSLINHYFANNKELV